MLSLLVIIVHTVIFNLNQVSAIFDNNTIYTNSSAKLAQATYKNVNYDKNRIPVVRGNNITVDIGLAIRQIHNVDEFHQLMEVSAWQRVYWHDDHVVWNPADFGGIDTIHVKESEIWTPDITLYTNGHRETKPMIENPRAYISFDGNVTKLYPIMFHVACEMDMR